LTSRAIEVWGSKRWIGWAHNSIAELMWDGTEEVRGSIHLVDALHIAVIEQVETFNGGLD
jgi:hypothetical protein